MHQPTCLCLETILTVIVLVLVYLYTKSIKRLGKIGGVVFCSDLLFNCALGLPKQDSGHWWSSFFFGKQNQMGTPNGFESQQK